MELGLYDANPESEYFSEYFSKGTREHVILKYI